MEWLKAWIPQKISNTALLAVWSFCACFGVSGRRSRRNYRENLAVLAEAAGTFRPDSFYRRNAYLENQGQWGAVRFGSFAMDYSGCEIIATYNALLSLGNAMSEADMAGLIGDYERRGAVFRGGWGVTPKAIRRYFRDRGYETAMTCSRTPEDLEAIAGAYPALILTVYNDVRDITQQVHTMHVSRQVSEDGKERFILHNAYRRDAGGVYVAGAPCGSLREVIQGIRGGAAAPISMIGIRRAGFAW